MAREPDCLLLPVPQDNLEDYEGAIAAQSSLPTSTKSPVPQQRRKSAALASSRLKVGIA
jgi:hypothetical protein